MPATLVAAFHATLEEISETDILLHVIDSSHPNAAHQALVVNDTLAQIGVGNASIITVFNKMDLSPNEVIPEILITKFPDGIPVSALSHIGLTRLHTAIQAILRQSLINITVDLPYTNGDLISLFHRQAVVSTVEHTDNSVLITGELPSRLASRFKKHVKT